MKITFKTLLMALIVSFLVYSCSSDDSDSNTDPTGIPDDSEALASPNISIDEITTLIPNVQFSDEGEYSVINMNLTGIQHPETKEWLRLYGTKLSDQNIWVEVDGKPKGILVQNLAAGESSNVLADLVFLVDNSGSMSQEANAVAEGIVDWATKLSDQGLDIQFGCVGYEHGGVNGALALSNLEGINNYLNRSGRNGTNRTVGYMGADSLQFSTTVASRGYSTYGECGVTGLRFADENFSFRYGSNRIYVNFTDEPNQPDNKTDWSVKYVEDQTTWNTSKGTIHTVFSADSTSFSVSELSREKPWLMSRYTGGTELFVRSDFANVTLDALPVTGAMANSYIIKFKNTSDLQDGTHTVKVTILSSDQKVKAVKEFTNVKFGK
jgi:hypothetical protein